jgi:YfiH family protein
LPWLTHGFTLRHPINSKAKLTLDFNNQIHNKKQISTQNQLIKTLSGKTLPLVLLNQTHSEKIYCLDRFIPDDSIKTADALITRLPEILLGIQVADCLSILVADPSSRVIAAIHAGWRGLLKGVVPKTISLMQSNYSVNPKNCIAVIGPSIGSCCYQVGDEVANAFLELFKKQGGIFDPKVNSLPHSMELYNRPIYNPKTRTLNLSAACRFQLQSCGLTPDKVSSDPPCTFCHNKVFFSYRRGKGRTGRMLAIIGLLS